MSRPRLSLCDGVSDVAQSKRDNKDPECPRIEIIGIRDGRRIYKIDDGHANGNPGKPNGQRQVIEALLRKKSEIDGAPLFVLAKRGSPFRVGKLQMEPVSGEVWSGEHEHRHESHLADLEAVKQAPPPAPNPLRTSISAAVVDKSEKKKAQTLGLDAGAVAAAGKKKAEEAEANG
jgi:hypothetical protein